MRAVPIGEPHVLADDVVKVFSAEAADVIQALALE